MRDETFTMWDKIKLVLEEICRAKPTTLSELSLVRKKATLNVAEIIQRRERTVEDACARSLGMSVFKFDQMVLEWLLRRSTRLLMNQILAHLERSTEQRELESQDVMAFFAPSAYETSGLAEAIESKTRQVGVSAEETDFPEVKPLPLQDWCSVFSFASLPVLLMTASTRRCNKSLRS